MVVPYPLSKGSTTKLDCDSSAPTISVILGSIVYRLVIALVLQLGMPPNDLKLFTALLVAVALSMPLIRETLQRQKTQS